MAVQYRRATTAQWAAEWATLVPADCEPVCEITTDGRRRWKLGDGAHVFADLPYQGELTLSGLGDISPTVVDLLAADNAAQARTAIGAASATDLAAAAAAMTVATANPQTVTGYTLVLGDAGKAVEMSNTAANTVTIPPNSLVPFPAGTLIEVFQGGAGQTTIAAGAGVAILSAGDKKRLAGQYSSASLRQSTTDVWVLVGDLVT